MRGLSVSLMAVAAAILSTTASASTPALRVPTRVVPVYEETLAPGASSLYSLCSTQDNTVFANKILSASNECAFKTSFSWVDGSLPTTAQREELCTCTQLMQQLQTLRVPRCSLYRGGQLVSYAQFIEYAFGLCNVDGTLASSSTSGSKASSSSTTKTPSAATTDDGSTTGEAKKSSKAPLIGGIVAGVVVIGVIVVFFLLRRRKSRRKSDPGHAIPDLDVIHAMPLSPIETNATNTGFVYTGTPLTPTTDSRKSSKSNKSGKNATAHTTATQKTSLSTGGSGGGGVRASELGRWEDPMIVAVRIPHDMIFFGPLLARGGYGEVYKGTYKGETVAIKQLLPDRRKDLAQIDDFLGEVKLMASLDHERIVRFIGVAWNSLSDACAVVEYMENGDLRSVLTRWDHGDEIRPQGFDADKVKIALHIAHALTYLHSLQPVVVHRDLKSKNILLTASYDAKLTDFGVSRERADSTMTAGVGSSLWMAPEVMMGERYNEKADVFSFGVVLSELDSHKLPYANVKETGTDTGRKIPDSAILQMVSLGRVRVAFSQLADRDLAQLGYDCVQVDPTKRPTSAEVLHRVHQVSRRVL